MKILIGRFLSVKNDGTHGRFRGHEVTLEKEQCRVDIRKFSKNRKGMEQIIKSTHTSEMQDTLDSKGFLVHRPSSTNSENDNLLKYLFNGATLTTTYV